MILVYNYNCFLPISVPISSYFFLISLICFYFSSSCAVIYLIFCSYFYSITLSFIFYFSFGYTLFCELLLFTMLWPFSNGDFYMISVFRTFIFYIVLLSSIILFLLDSIFNYKSSMIESFSKHTDFIYLLCHFIIYFPNYCNWSRIPSTPIKIVALSLAPKTCEENFFSSFSYYLYSFLCALFNS